MKSCNNLLFEDMKTGNFVGIEEIDDEYGMR